MKNEYIKHGYVRITSASPELFLAKPLENAKTILNIFKYQTQNQSLITVFPELSLTGYTCEDLFHTQDLLDQTKLALEFLLRETRGIKGVLVVGFPYQTTSGKIFNMAGVICEGKLLGMVPKLNLPNYNEFYEKRWFNQGSLINDTITDFGQTFLVSADQVFKINNNVIIGVEICEDLFSPLPPSTNLALNGANIIVNLSASNELVGKISYRKELVQQQSARLNCAYIYSSASSGESTKDIVFGGHCIICENGTILTESQRFSFETSTISMEIDLNKLQMERRKNQTFSSTAPLKKVTEVSCQVEYQLNYLLRKYSQTPFVPTGNSLINERSQEILNIQSTGLARRLLSVGKPKMLLGLSGGLDSTLALLVCLEAIKRTNQSPSDIICVSMPGFGTSERTKNQAHNLAKESGVSFLEIDITNSVKTHFEDIGHSQNQLDVVYENAQARERTQILFDLANKHKGIVIGTGNLSENFLGFCTFSGDQLSNYGVNGSVPKTLVQHLVKYYAENKSTPSFASLLHQVLETKISPELLPPDKDGNIAQQSEELVGPYLLNDFFIFHYLRNGFTLDKIAELARLTFIDKFDDATIEKWLRVCFTRFKNNQFKRTVMPASPKVGSVSLSPRGDWRMPDET